MTLRGSATVPDRFVDVHFTRLMADPEYRGLSHHPALPPSDAAPAGAEVGT